MGLIDDIKNQARKAGSNKGKIVYFKPGVKNRVRFLHEMDEGMKVLFHDSFEAGVNVPCQELYDRDCEHHDDDTMRHADNYIWSVWDYESKEVKLLMGKVNNFSPIPSLVGFYDTYGSIKDRDYVITKNGSGTNQTWSIVPMDKVKFKNDKAKPFSERKVMEILDKAFPSDSDEDEDEEPKKKKKGKRRDEEDEEEDVAPKKRKKARDDDEDEDDEEPKKKKVKRKPEPEEDEEEEDEEDSDGEEDYEDMTALELYKLCKKRKIDVPSKKSERFYIKALEAADEDGDEEDEDDEDNW